MRLSFVRLCKGASLAFDLEVFDISWIFPTIYITGMDGHINFWMIIVMLYFYFKWYIYLLDNLNV